MAENILNLAVERKAERVERFGADGLAVLHAVDGVGGKALAVNQIVFRQSFFKERFIKRSVADHVFHLKEILTYLIS